MIAAKFSDLIKTSEDENGLIDKIYQYLIIMNLYDPHNPRFQNEFSNFYQLNVSSYWGNVAHKREFFAIFSRCFDIAGKRVLTYDDVIRMFNGRNEKSFSSKILHTIYPYKPIVDQRMLDKLERDGTFKNVYPNPALNRKSLQREKSEIIVGGNNWQDTIAFYNNLEMFYVKLVEYNKNKSNSVETYVGNGEFCKDEVNNTYFENFDIWAKEKGLPIHLLTFEKKMDFYLWLA